MSDTGAGLFLLNYVLFHVQWFLKNLGPDGLPRLIADWEDKSAAALCLFGYCEVRDPKAFKVLCTGAFLYAPYSFLLISLSSG
jgi:hypothetical protein